jgi:hypothetical protein
MAMRPKATEPLGAMGLRDSSGGDGDVADTRLASTSVGIRLTATGRVWRPRGCGLVNLTLACAHCRGHLYPRKRPVTYRQRWAQVE